MTIYDKPINNGSDAWLRLMRELEAEAYDDSISCHVPLAASPTLEDIAKAAVWLLSSLRRVRVFAACQMALVR